MRLAVVTQRVDVIADRGERRDALDQRLAAWLLKADLLTVPVPNRLLDYDQALDSWLEKIDPSLLVLSGGNDIGEVRERDETERRLLKWAKQHSLPVLGICRGMQMMALWSGGALQAVADHVRQRHSLFVESGSHGCWPNEVNSYHTQGLRNCPPGFEVQVRSEDGAIEAIRHSRLPWEGWMWHPERETRDTGIESGRALALVGPSPTDPPGSA